MSATIYQFPVSLSRENQQTYKLSLYSDLEIEVVLICVNVFDSAERKINCGNLSSLDPKIVIDCLEQGKKSLIFSSNFKTIIDTILSNTQTE